MSKFSKKLILAVIASGAIGCSASWAKQSLKVEGQDLPRLQTQIEIGFLRHNRDALFHADWITYNINIHDASSAAAGDNSCG